jgi:hypothetical protein
LASGQQQVAVGGRDLIPVVARVQRVIGRGTCLEESVGLAAVLTRHGRQPELVVGCRRVGAGTWAAHAWVIVDDVRLDQAPNEQHTALASYQAHDGWAGRPLPATPLGGAVTEG